MKKRRSAHPKGSNFTGSRLVGWSLPESFFFFGSLVDHYSSLIRRTRRSCSTIDSQCCDKEWPEVGGKEWPKNCWNDVGSQELQPPKWPLLVIRARMIKWASIEKLCHLKPPRAKYFPGWIHVMRPTCSSVHLSMVVDFTCSADSGSP